MEKNLSINCSIQVTGDGCFRYRVNNIDNKRDKSEFENLLKGYYGNKYKTKFPNKKDESLQKQWIDRKIKNKMELAVVK